MLGCVIMVAPRHVFTISYIARQLGVGKVTIEDIALSMEPEDECLGVKIRRERPV